MFNSLKARLIALTLFCASLAMIPISLLLIERNSQTLETQLNGNLKEISNMKQSQLQRHHEMISKMAISLGNNSLVTEFLTEGTESDQLFELCQNFQQSYWGIIHHVFLANTEGTVTYSPDKTGTEMSGHLNEHVGESPFFEKAKTEMVVTDFFGFSEKDHYHQILFQPVIKDGTTIGVIGIEVCIDYIMEILKEGIAEEGISVFLTTLEGQTIVNAMKDIKPARTTEALQEAKAKGTFAGITTGKNGKESYAYYHRSEGTPWLLCVEEDADIIVNQVAQAKEDSIKAAIIALSLAVAIGLGAAIRISRPIVHMNKQMVHGIEKNDLKLTVQSSSIKEMNAMATGFNGFMEKIRTLIGETRETSSSIETTSRDLNNEADQLLQVNQSMQSSFTQASEATQSIGEHAIELSSQTKKAQDMIASVTQATEDMGSSLEQVSSQAMESDQMVMRTEEAMDRLRRSIEEVSSTLAAGNDVRAKAMQKVQDASNIKERLDKSAKAVDEITRVIEKLADQTSLLALNATIEAEKAGEAGRSFAVVALDVKNLAGQSSDSAELINKQIGEMQVGAREIGTAIEEITEIVQTLHEMDDKVSEAMQQQVETTDAVSNIVQEESGLLRDITTGITNVAAGVSQVLNQIDALSKYLTTVDESAETSTELSAHVAASIDAIGQDCNQLSQVVNTLNTCTSELQERFERLDQLVAPYQT